MNLITIKKMYHDHIIFVLGSLFIIGLFLVIEFFVLPQNERSINFLLDKKNRSTKDDLFYFILAMLGGRVWGVILVSFGFSVFLEHQIRTHLNLQILKFSTVYVQFLVYFFLKTFIFYVVHRIMHTKLLWKIHEIHHAQLHFNLLAPFRNHPVDSFVVAAFALTIGALLGVSPKVSLAYNIINGLYQTLVHSNIKLKSPWINRYLFITPEGHRIHHSNLPGHFNKNFGILSLWDHLFGTYMDQCDEGKGKLEIGFENKLHNSGTPFKSFCRLTLNWYKELFTFFHLK